MKEPTKDFNQFYESETTESRQTEIYSKKKSGHNLNLSSAEVERNENKKLFSFRQLLEAYSKFYDRVKPIFTILWILVFLVIILPIIGEFVITRSLSSPEELIKPQTHSEIIFNESKNIELISASQILDQFNTYRNQTKINKELLNAVDYAHRKAESQAIRELNSWIDTLMFKVDNDFFDWYFNFVNKKWREDSALITWVTGGDVQKRQGKIFIEGFAKRVVNKAEAEQKIQQIVNNTVETYVNELGHKLDRTGFEYNIPKTQWNEYLDNITFNIPGTGNTNLAEITAVGFYPLAKAIAVPSLKGMSIVGAEKITAIAGAKYAAKLGLKGISETAIGTFSKAADPILLAGFVFYEIGEHHATVGRQKPALHDSLFETFKEIEDDILYDNKSGIITTLYGIENSIRDSISSKTSFQLNSV